MAQLPIRKLTLWKQGIGYFERRGQVSENVVRVLTLPVTQLQGIQLLDDRARDDVSFFLDVSQTEQTRTTLTVQLATGEHDLEITHLAPSPIWRMSYRLTRTDDRHAQLTAW